MSIRSWRDFFDDWRGESGVRADVVPAPGQQLHRLLPVSDGEDRMTEAVILERLEQQRPIGRVVRKRIARWQRRPSLPLEDAVEVKERRSDERGSGD
jgi:hypothetical protein